VTVFIACVCVCVCVCVCACVRVLPRVQDLQRLTLTMHINRVVVEMGSSLLLHITLAIIPLASQCASSVIRWKQTLVLAAGLCLQESEHSCILTFTARGLQSFQHTIHRVKHSFLFSPSNQFFFLPAEPSRGPL